MERTRRILIDQLLPLGLVYAPDESTEEIRRNASNHVLSAGCVFPWSARETLAAVSSYDLVLVVTDLGRFVKEDAWISDYGRPIARWGDQSTIYGLARLFRGVLMRIT